MQLKLSRSEIINSRFNTAANRVPPADLPAKLLAASHVLVRQDEHVLPLSPLYDGPYAVLRRSLHTFTILMGDREEVVSTSRLKPCRTPTWCPLSHIGAASRLGQQGSRGYLPVVLLALPAHPQLH